MVSTEQAAREQIETTGEDIWAFRPDIPLANVPVFVWPLRVMEAIKFLVFRPNSCQI